MITAHTACAVCLICRNRTVLILALNLVFTHFGTGYGVSEHTCISLCIFFQKSVVILNINPVRTDTDGNFACFKVLRDNFFKSRNVLFKIAVNMLCIFPCNFQLFSDIARKIFGSLLISRQRFIILYCGGISENVIA